MYEKLDKLREEVRRAEKRKKYADEKFNTLQEKLREAESMQILADVGAMHLTPEQVAIFLSMAASGKLPKVNPDGSIEQENADGSGDEPPKMPGQEETMAGEPNPEESFTEGFRFTNEKRTENGSEENTDFDAEDDDEYGKEDELDG